MTTAQDQQSRAEFEAIYRSDAFQAGILYGSSKEVAYAVWQAARALPQSMEPVAEIVECGVMGQQTVTEVDGAWKFLPFGTKLYTAAQVQAMGRVPPGWQAVPAVPTEEMIAVGRNYTTLAAGTYLAMCAAAPRPPAAQEGS